MAVVKRLMAAASPCRALPGELALFPKLEQRKCAHLQVTLWSQPYIREGDF
jgi:hypothetical protein